MIFIKMKLNDAFLISHRSNQIINQLCPTLSYRCNHKQILSTIKRCNHMIATAN
ncbi:hypothetical protein JOC75_000558 [Metabacillus crassostreae]|nr:hypothetical protein [Metabacillus crassostreae]